MISTRLYKNGVLDLSDFDPTLVSEYLQDHDSMVWLDLTSPTLEELKLIQEEFYLHPLAIEDATHSHQRPKVDRYKGHLFLVLYSAGLQGVELATSEVDVFFNRRFIITVRKEPAWPIEAALERWDKGGELIKHGTTFLLYGLMDAIVDEYLEAARQLQERLDETEDVLLQPTKRVAFEEDLFSLRRSLVMLRRVAAPMQETTSTLVDKRLLELDDQIGPYFTDVKDHLARVVDSVDAMQHLLYSALNLFLSLASTRLNDAMRRVTSWAAIIAVATTIAGIYGMNFKLWPSGDNPYSFWIALGMITTCSVGLFVFFRKRGWI